MLVNIDCFGARLLADGCAATQQFLFADFHRSIHIHNTSLNLDDDSRVFGGSQGKLIMVAEGLGPEDSGQRASTVAVDAVTQYLLNAFRIAEQASVGDASFESKLLAALEHCQETMQRESDALESRSGMGAEVTVAYILWPHLYVVQVGRTSCSVWRNALMKELGSTVSSEIVGGASERLSPVFSDVDLRVGDKLLVCSRSVRQALDTFQITSLLNSRDPAATICRQLTEAAADNGCEEATVVVACFDEGVAVDPESQMHAELTGEAAASAPQPKTPEAAVEASTKDGVERGAERT